MTDVDLPFKRIIEEDFEFISKPGERPDIVCWVYHDLNTKQTIRLWRDQIDRLNGRPPYEDGDDTLVVSFVFNAEGACRLSLGLPLPRHVLDLSAEFKCHVNGKGILRKNQGLVGALQYFGVNSIAPKHKDAMRARIMRGWPFTAEEKQQILDYCAEDVEALHQLLLKLLPHIDLPIALHRGEAVAALARSEHIGVPIHMAVFPQLADQKTWRELRDSMVPLVDVHGIYVCDRRGEFHWSNARFEEWTAAAGMNWPRKENNGKLDLRRKTFDSMGKAYPQVEPLRQLRYIRDKLRTIKLSVGHDGRNRTVLWPFSSKTSRTQPQAKHWIFSPSVWLRHLIKPERGRALAYIDFASMEFGAAAALSDGHSGPNNNPVLDLYHTFGKIIGLIDPNATRQTSGVEAIRERLKVLCLGTQYGMQAGTLATRLGCSEIEAHENADASPRSLLTILEVERRLAAPFAQQWLDAHGVRLAVRYRHHRIQ